MPEWLLLLAGIVVIALWFLSVYTALRIGAWLVLSSPHLRRAYHRGIGRAMNIVTEIRERHDRRSKP